MVAAVAATLHGESDGLWIAETSSEQMGLDEQPHGPAPGAMPPGLSHTAKGQVRVGGRRTPTLAGVGAN